MKTPLGGALADPHEIIADLRRQLAELTAERDEALAQQTATAEVLQVINSSPGDLAPVWDAMLEKATLLCEATIGTLWTFDGDGMRAAAILGAPPEYAEFLTRGPLSPTTVQQRLLHGEQTIQIADLAASDLYRSGNPLARAAVDLGGVRTLLAVALRKDDAFLGHFAIYRKEVRPFSDKQIALLQNFAAQAVIAMENARLLTETRARECELQEALEYQTGTSVVLAAISRSAGDLVPVFQTIVETAARICEADTAAIMRLQDGRYCLAAAFGVSEDWERFVRQHPMEPGRGTVTARVALERRVIRIEDVTTDPDYELPQAHRIGGFRTALGVPLMHDGVPIAVIALGRLRVEAFGEKQIALVQTFAAQAVIAMENARLITETREALEQQTATAEVLGVINASPGKLTPVFEAMVEKAMRLAEADAGMLMTHDAGTLKPAVLRGVPAAYADFLDASGVQPRLGGLTQRIVGGAGIMQDADVRQTEGYRSGHPWTRALVDLGGARSAIAVPLRKDDALLGTISLYRREVRPFTDKQIALLQNFAVQAVIAMENARLLGELRQRTEEVAELNRGLEARVAEQVDELGRVGRLKRFLAPQLAELIVSQGDENILESHRREIVVVFCDLRGYTAFTETAEPEEVLDFLREYHGALGPLVAEYEGTLDQFSGDGIMVFFNDPVPIPDPAARAVEMAVAMREAASALISSWRRLGRDLGFGAGIAQGYATLGQIGFSERSGYTAIGTVCNVAARLCAEAKDGQILMSQRVAARLNKNIALEDIGALTLKGLTQPVVAFNVPLAAGQPGLRVIDGGPPNGD